MRRPVHFASREKPREMKFEPLRTARHVHLLLLILARLPFDVLDQIGDGLDLFNRVVLDFDVKLVFNIHHEHHHGRAIRLEILLEASFRLHFDIHAEPSAMVTSIITDAFSSLSFYHYFFTMFRLFQTHFGFPAC